MDLKPVSKEEYEAALKTISAYFELPSHSIEKVIGEYKSYLPLCCKCGVLLHDDNIARYPDGEIRTDSGGAKGCQVCASGYDEARKGAIDNKLSSIQIELLWELAVYGPKIIKAIERFSGKFTKDTLNSLINKGLATANGDTFKITTKGKSFWDKYTQLKSEYPKHEDESDSRYSERVASYISEISTIPSISAEIDSTDTYPSNKG